MIITIRVYWNKGPQFSNLFASQLPCLGKSISSTQRFLDIIITVHTSITITQHLQPLGKFRSLTVLGLANLARKGHVRLALSAKISSVELFSPLPAIIITEYDFLHVSLIKIYYLVITYRQYHIRHQEHLKHKQIKILSYVIAYIQV